MGAKNENDLQITGLQFVADGVEISYIRVPADIRQNGLIWSHAVLIPRASDYDDELGAFEEALRDLLLDVLDDEDRAEPIDMTETEEDK